MYDNVLVPTDGSEGVQEAIQEGVDIAELCDATVHALYVVDESQDDAVPDASWQEIRAELENAGEEAVTQVSGEAKRKGLDAERAVVAGVPHEAIMEYAAEHDVDLIVMGTHGRSGLDRFLLGSVTERVIRSADVPVLVVRIGEDAAADA